MLLIFPLPCPSSVACTQSTAGLSYTFIHLYHLESYRTAVTCWLIFIASQPVSVTPNYCCCLQTMIRLLWDEMSSTMCFSCPTLQLAGLLWGTIPGRRSREQPSREGSVLAAPNVACCTPRFIGAALGVGLGTTQAAPAINPASS